ELDWDKRKAPRSVVQVSGAVALRPPAQAPGRSAVRLLPAHINDLSRTGMSLYVRRGEGFAVATTLTVRMTVGRGECDVPGKVIWCLPDGEGAARVGVRMYLEVLDTGTRRAFDSLVSDAERRSCRSEEDDERTRVTFGLE